MQHTEVRGQNARTRSVRYHDPIARRCRVRGVVPSVYAFDEVGTASHVHGDLATENDDVAEDMIIAKEFNCGRTSFTLCVVKCICKRVRDDEQM